MVSFNRTIVGGNLTRDPELRYTQTGIPVCDFGIAVDRVRSKQEDAVDYFNITAWRELGETIANYKTKGDPVLIEGRLEYSSWETDDGQKRSAVKIVADQVQFLPGGAGNNNGGGSNGNGNSGGGTRQAAAHGRGQEPAEDEDEDFDSIPFAVPARLKRPIF